MDQQTAEVVGILTLNNADSRQIGGEHYKTMDIEPWEVLQGVLTPEQWRGFLIGNAIKYSMRQGRKVDANDDAEKARHYLQKLREIEDGYAGF